MGLGPSLSDANYVSIHLHSQHKTSIMFIVNNWEPVPDMVDRLGGRNMNLSDQAVSAITIDALPYVASFM
ncbi:hypothetical protein RJT34_25667 [Clitoria ternatea]|uniref:Uncharacterized protein n=1 Tax=Clitoria ternatea TaxID=43366 RepID=A0AAN9FQ80_CLITE